MVTIAPGEDPYKQLDAEEGELLYTVGDETKSDVHPDDAEGDDLSVITIDSLKELDSEKSAGDLEGHGRGEGERKRILQQSSCNGG